MTMSNHTEEWKKTQMKEHGGWAEQHWGVDDDGVYYVWKWHYMDGDTEHVLPFPYASQHQAVEGVAWNY